MDSPEGETHRSLKTELMIRRIKSRFSENGFHRRGDPSEPQNIVNDAQNQKSTYENGFPRRGDPPEPQNRAGGGMVDTGATAGGDADDTQWLQGGLRVRRDARRATRYGMRGTPS